MSVNNGMLRMFLEVTTETPLEIFPGLSTQNFLKPYNFSFLLEVKLCLGSYVFIITFFLMNIFFLSGILFGKLYKIMISNIVR